MAPGGIRADEHGEIGLVEILVAAGHGIGAEGALVAGDGGGHAQARVGVDVGRADEALHQLVGDVIVLRQQLARDVEGDRIGPMPLDRRRESPPRRGRARRPRRCAPARRSAPRSIGMEQTPIERQGFAERRALRAEAAEVCRMRADRPAIVCAAEAVGPRQHAAADPAIGAGRADGGRRRRRASMRCPQ